MLQLHTEEAEAGIKQGVLLTCRAAVSSRACRTANEDQAVNALLTTADRILLMAGFSTARLWLRLAAATCQPANTAASRRCCMRAWQADSICRARCAWAVASRHLSKGADT